MEQLEAHLDVLWDENRQKRKDKISELNDALVKSVRENVGATMCAVQSALTSEQPTLEREIERLLHMADEFATGVEIWQQKAMNSIESIAEQQSVLGSTVRDASIRTAARKEDLLKRQRQRAEEVQRAVMDRFKEVEHKL